MSDEAKPDKIPRSETDVGRFQAIADYSKSKMKLSSVDISARVRDFDPKKAVEAVLDAPKRLKREWQRSGATGVITRFPIATVARGGAVSLSRNSGGGWLATHQKTLASSLAWYSLASATRLCFPTSSEMVGDMFARYSPGARPSKPFSSFRAGR